MNEVIVQVDPRWVGAFGVWIARIRRCPFCLRGHWVDLGPAKTYGVRTAECDPRKTYNLTPPEWTQP